MSSLLERMMKSGKVKEATLISESKFFDKKDLVDIGIPILNVAFSADIDGGMSPGLTVWAGQSKTFKTLGALISAAAYQRKHDDGLIILYDTEFGITPEYLTSCGIDNERVLHIPIESVEQLKFDMVDRLENIEKGDHVMFVIDSIGMLASKKEVEDAIEGKAVADMTRAKALKSLFRLVTSKLTILEIPCIAINHTYADIGSSVPREIVGGGNGAIFAANTIFVVTKAQEKNADNTELLGYKFTLNIEKSRYVRERSKIAFKVMYDGGIQKWSGLFDLGLESNFIGKSAQGWYTVVDFETGEMLQNKRRKADIESDNEFFESMIANQNFKDFVHRKYAVA